MYKAVLFDMDGVLVNSEPYYRQRRDDFLASRGLWLSSSFDGTGSNDQEIWRQLVPDDEDLRDQLRHAYATYANEHPVPWRDLLNPDAWPTCEGLRERGVKVAICSSSHRRFIEGFVSEVGLSEFIDLIVAGDECAELKPSPEPYLMAMRGLGVCADEVVVVEDSTIGIEAGKRSGAMTCALAPLPGTQTDQSAADRHLSRLTEVLDLAGA